MYPLSLGINSRIPTHSFRFFAIQVLKMATTVKRPQDLAAKAESQPKPKKPAKESAKQKPAKESSEAGTAKPDQVKPKKPAVKKSMDETKAFVVVSKTSLLPDDVDQDSPWDESGDIPDDLHIDSGPVAVGWFDLLEDANKAAKSAFVRQNPFGIKGGIAGFKRQQGEPGRDDVDVDEGKNSFGGFEFDLGFSPSCESYSVKVMKGPEFLLLKSKKH